MADEFARALEPTGYDKEAPAAARIPQAAKAAAAAAAAAREAPAPPVPNRLIRAEESEAARRLFGERDAPKAEADDDSPWLKRILVVGDETLCFTTAMQNAHTEFEFSAMTVLSRENIDNYGFEPMPAVLSGRVQHMTDPCKLVQSFPPHFDGAVLFLPGLAFTVPKELGTADRPLFAFRTHLFAFYLLRQVKQVLRKATGHVHLVWPDEMAIMSAPFGGAGVEMTQLLVSCGCVPLDPMFDMGKLEANSLTPFIFGEVKESSEIPDWMEGVNIQSFSVSREAIPVPLSVALLLHPEVGYTTIKDGRSSASPVAVAAAAATAVADSLAKEREEAKRAGTSKTEPEEPKKTDLTLPEDPSRAEAEAKLHIRLVLEAAAVKPRLRESCQGRRPPLKYWGIVPEPSDEDSLLTVPLEIFNIGFEGLGHVSQLLRFVICPEQPLNSVSQMDVLDPRLPVRISKPPKGVDSSANPIMSVMSSLAAGTGLPNAFIGGKDTSDRGRRRERHNPRDPWGDMPFYCQLTKICTYTAQDMREHMRGDLYRRLANNTPGWHDSVDKKDLIHDLDESDREARRRVRSRTRSPPLRGRSPYGRGRDRYR